MQNKILDAQRKATHAARRRFDRALQLGLFHRDLGRVVDEGVQRACALDGAQAGFSQFFGRCVALAQRIARLGKPSVFSSVIIQPPSAQQRTLHAHRAHFAEPCLLIAVGHHISRRFRRCGVTEVIGSTPSHPLHSICSINPEWC